MLQDTFTFLLIVALGASVVSFVVMGLRQWTRTRRLARKAHEMNLHFSPSDMFDAPQRYGDFSLISSGHGPSACNVTHGHLRRVPVRAFDFRYEAGHATRRITRHYGVIAVQTPLALGKLVMWHVDDLHAASLPINLVAKPVGKWVCSGDMGLADVLAEAIDPLSDQYVSVEVRDGALMLCIPIFKKRQDYTSSLGHIDRILEAIEEYGDRAIASKF